jgi:hypothetical protein
MKYDDFYPHKDDARCRLHVGWDMLESNVETTVRMK